MRKRILLSAAAAVAAGCLDLATANATVVNVPNFSFESPAGPFSLQVSLTIANWTTSGPADESVGPGLNGGVGIFQNSNPGLPGYATNADGTQMAYMFSGSPVATDPPHMIYQALSTPFAANTQYTLTVGVEDAGSPPTVGDQFSLQLYYTTAADPNTPIILSATNVTQGVSSLSSTALTDYSVTIPGLSTGNSAIGNDIGIMFTTSGVGGGEFDLDNVRLTSNPAPEPAGLALVAFAGAAGLLGRRRASRVR